MGRAREQAHTDGEEVEHQVAADQVGSIAQTVGVAACSGGRQQEQAGGLDGRGGQDDDVGPQELWRARRIQVVHTGGPLLVRAELDLRDVGAGHQVGAGQEGVVEEGHGRAAACVDRASEAGAEAARVARRPPVEGLGVDGHRKRVGRVPDPPGPLFEEEAGVHGRVGRLRELVLAGGSSLGVQGRWGHLLHIALDPELGLDLVVEGGQLLVLEGPVGHVGVRDRTVERQGLEVLLPEARRLGVPVDRAPADHGGQVVDVTDEAPVRPLLGIRLGTGRPRLQDGILILEEAALLYLVVAEQRADAARRPQAGQEVAALLQQGDGEAGPGELPRGHAGARARAHDEDGGLGAHGRP